jgi:thermolysin
MEDISRKVGTFDNRNTTSSTYRFADANNIWDSSSQRAGVDAHYGAEKFYDYYLNTHNRRGIDGNGGPGYYLSIDGVTALVSSKVHYGVNYNNAFWNGSYMTYGDGDGVRFSPLVTLDICGHEMQHGVTERTANLVYSGESGALNESWSDVFGALLERYVRGQSTNTWRIGEQSYTPGTAGDALRYMDNPHAASNAGYTADDDPDHYSERYTGTADSGGVHVNSGISNKVFYLLAVGGTHHRGGSMTGIGADAAGKIWYRALTSYMTSSTNFRGARTATLNAAAALYGTGSTNYNAVAQAWTLCGVS